MTTMTKCNIAEDNGHELGQEFKKLASMVPNLPKDECLSELEFIESVIDYIRQLQQLVTHDQWTECLNKLASSMKTSYLSSSQSSSTHSPTNTGPLFNEFMIGSPRTSTNENLSAIRRSPLATLNLDNTRLSWTVISAHACVALSLFVYFVVHLYWLLINWSGYFLSISLLQRKKRHDRTIFLLIIGHFCKLYHWT